MESPLFKNDLLTAHEPRKCKSLEINETISRFMESGVGAGAMLTDHEPGWTPGGGTPPCSRFAIRHSPFAVHEKNKVAL